jgi:hypothetical protein
VLKAFELPLGEFDRRHLQGVHVPEAGMEDFVYRVAVRVACHGWFLVLQDPRHAAAGHGVRRYQQHIKSCSGECAIQRFIPREPG